MELLHFTLTICSAFCLGLLLGLERQWRGHPAGLRTNVLVCLGASLFVSISMLKGDEDSKTRIASYIVSGIGFLGGGVILREGFHIRGMNTAATLWCSAAVGTLAGIGYPLHALHGTLAVLFVHLFLRPVAHWIDRIRKPAKDVEVTYQIRASCNQKEQNLIRSVLLRLVNAQPKMTLQGIAIDVQTRPDLVEVVAEIFSLERNDRVMEEIIRRLDLETGVDGVSWKKLQ